MVYTLQWLLFWGVEGWGGGGVGYALFLDILFLGNWKMSKCEYLYEWNTYIGI